MVQINIYQFEQKIYLWAHSMGTAHWVGQLYRQKKRCESDTF